MQKKITVNIRIRDSLDDGGLWQVKDKVLYQKMNPTTQLTYSCYQNVFHQTNTTIIFDECIKELIGEVLLGTNCTIFAYGQTGSGKTYTMLGNEKDPGIIRLSLETILQSNKKISISYLEIYNENIIDLINSDKKVKIYSMSNNSHISGVSKIMIKDMDDALEIIDKCEGKRKIGQTDFNLRSSRSHTVFQIYVELQNKGSTLSLIDLAGSERASGSAERRKEGAYINKSLLALGSVVNKLIKNEYVNYRDSKLTRILQQSLDGNSNVVSLCMISPNEECLLESISTLKFAARLSKIELKDKQTRMVTINEDECEKCKCCIKKGIIDKNNNTIDFADDRDSFTKENDDVEIIDKKPFKEEKKLDENLILRAENDLYIERIKNLDDTINSLIKQNPSKRISDLYELEKNMFQLQLEIIKRKK
ncbi:Kinesin-like protein kip2 [Gurleya vavrai]